MNQHYVTPEGMKALRDWRKALKKERIEIAEIVNQAAANGDRSENADYHYNKRRMIEIDKKSRYLDGRMDTAIIVYPGDVISPDRVSFGAIVSYINQEEAEITIRLVGADQADLSSGSISYESPVGRALMNKEEGDIVIVKTPAGPQEIEVTNISWPEEDTVLA